MPPKNIYIGSDMVPSAATWCDQKNIGAHLSPITCVDVQNGLIVTGGYDGHVIRWDDDLCEPLWSIRFADLINSVSIAPGGGQAAIAVADGHAYVVDIVSGLIRRRLGPHGDDVNDVAWHPGRAGFLATVCDARDPARVYLWAIDDDAPIARLREHGHGVFAIAYAPGGRYFATASEDATVRIWTAGDEPEVVKILDHPGDVETIAWSHDGKELATGCDDGVLRLWSATDWKACHELTEATASVRKVGFSPSNRRVFGASYDGNVRVYDRASRRLIATRRTALQWERACALANDETLVVGSFGDRPHRLAVSGPRPGGGDRLANATCGVNALATDERGETYVGTDCGDVVRLSDGCLLHSASTMICGVRAAPDGSPVAISDYLGDLVLSSGAGRAVLIGRATGGPLNSVEFTPGSTLTTGGYDGSIRLWSRDGRELDRALAHGGPIKSVVWCQGSGLLIAGSSDNTLSAWRVDGRLHEAYRYQADGLVLVNAVAASADGTWAAVASRDGIVRIWHPQTDGMTELPRVHEKSVKAVAVCPDGRTIASGGYDGTVIFWSLDDVGRLRGWRQTRLHGKPGISSISAQADRVMTAGWNGTVAEWTPDGRLRRHYVRVAVDGRVIRPTCPPVPSPAEPPRRPR